MAPTTTNTSTLVSSCQTTTSNSTTACASSDGATNDGGLQPVHWIAIGFSIWLFIGLFEFVRIALYKDWKSMVEEKWPDISTSPLRMRALLVGLVLVGGFFIFVWPFFWMFKLFFWMFRLDVAPSPPHPPAPSSGVATPSPAQVPSTANVTATVPPSEVPPSYEEATKNVRTATSTADTLKF